MKENALIIIVTCSLAFPGLACQQSKKELPSRTDCIVGARLTWSKAQDNIAVRKLAIQLADELRAASNGSIAVTRFDNLRILYAIFRKECDSKNARFFEMLVEVSAKIGGGLLIEMIEEPIAPGVDTIEAYGPSWRDGTRPERPE